VRVSVQSERSGRRRRKKKRKQSKTLLWLILSGAMVLLLIAGVVVIINLPAGAQGGGKPGDQAQQPPQGPPDAPQPGPAQGGQPGNQVPAPNAPGGVEMSLTSKIKKKIDFLDWQNEMRQIAQFYIMYADDFRHPPKTVKAFQEYIKKDYPQLVGYIDAGYYVVIPNQKPSSHSILAYQNKDLRFGTRYVVKGDGSFHELGEAEFKAELQQQGP